MGSKETYEAKAVVEYLRKFKDELWLDANGELNFRQFNIGKIKTSE